MSGPVAIPPYGRGWSCPWGADGAHPSAAVMRDGVLICTGLPFPQAEGLFKAADGQDRPATAPARDEPRGGPSRPRRRPRPGRPQRRCRPVARDHVAWPDGSGCGGAHCAATYVDVGKKVWWAKVKLKSSPSGWVNMNTAEFNGVDLLARRERHSPREARVCGGWSPSERLHGRGNIGCDRVSVTLM